jgi:trk system potassium uptake protein TrkH
MNWKLVIKVIGLLLFIEAGLMALCMGVGLYYDEYCEHFLWPISISTLLGCAGWAIGKNASANMGRKDGYLVVSLVWVIFTLIGMLPFLMSGSIPDVAGALFETMSGFTSTGATVIDNCDIQPHSILMWRSLAQWIGGIGIIFFTIAILPAFGVGEVKLFAAEATGPMHDKVHPRISITAKWIGTVYLALTLLCITSFYLCGMSPFDAVNYALVTTATGGFGTHSAMLHDVYNSPLLEYVISFFMFISGVNYTLIYYTILKGRIKKFLANVELRCYLTIVIGTVLTCTIILMVARTDFSSVDTTSVSTFFSTLELAFRESLFTIISLQTTTGLATCDYTLWPVSAMPILLFVMFAGACSGSTSGGFKCIRWSIIYRVVRNEFKRILHPRAMLPVRMGGTILPTQIQQTLLAFVALFVGALFGGAFHLALFGISPTADYQSFDYYEALGLSMASLSNVGPAMGYYGPAHSWAILSPIAKCTCSVLMLIGRLEIFPVLLLFTRSFWKKT